MGKITNFFIARQENNYRPPVLSYKAFLIYALVLLLLRLFLLAPPPAEAAAVESGLIMNLINSERAARNIPTLLLSPALNTAADGKSSDMLARDYFAHIDPDGDYVWGRIVKAGYAPYKILGENLAIDFSTSEGMVKAWVDSPTHRANMLNTDFIDQGLKTLYGNFQERYTNVTTSLFGALYPVAGESAARPAPQTVPNPPPPEPKEALSQTINNLPPAPTDATLTAPLAREKYILPGLVEEIKTVIPAPKAAGEQQPFWPRLVFTLFGVVMLAILTIDTIIIYGRQIITGRGHSSYHFLNFFLLVIISILIWWW
ncbi:MAG: CAP domain-containing protein [Candidatus Doudnabacteria bacterium]|nr:CAP domain-containing protein [Candidatus Doudnabacteria bacterium]